MCSMYLLIFFVRTSLMMMGEREERWWKIRDKVPTQKRMRNAINFCIRLLDGTLLFVGCHLCDALHFEASQRGRHTGRGPARKVFFLLSLWRRLIGGGKRENYFTFVPLLESKQIINSTRLRERISWLSTMIDFLMLCLIHKKLKSCSYSNSNPPMMHNEWQAIVTRSSTSKRVQKASLHAVNDVMKIFPISTWLFSLLSSSQHIFRQSRWYESCGCWFDEDDSAHVSTLYTFFFIFGEPIFLKRERTTCNYET